MDTNQISQQISLIEQELSVLKQMIGVETDSSMGHFMQPRRSMHPAMNPYLAEDQGFEGIFDGERMISSDGKTYPVPPNYASKSKLVEGDPLKLFIAPDGRNVYKQLGPVERRMENGILLLDGSHYTVQTASGTYGILTACVTYHMAISNMQVGDMVQIILPADRPARWAVIEGHAPAEDGMHSADQSMDYPVNHAVDHPVHGDEDVAVEKVEAIPTLTTEPGILDA
jgi:hypothetical protein